MRIENRSRNALWAVVLAAGEGKRMSPYIRAWFGVHSPKQYVVFTGKRSMLRHTLDRVRRLIPPERTLVVVSPDHMWEIKAQLSEIPRENLIFQPYNRETAPGVLLPLIYILKRDPSARVAIFPSDHFILEEGRFMNYVEQADRLVQRFSDQVILLGAVPEGPEVGYGWIEPDASLPDWAARRIKSFHEKPDPESALLFFQRRFLWNTFVTITRAETLMERTKRLFPALWDRFKKMLSAIGSRYEWSIIEQEYRGMESVNLSRDLFQKSSERMGVIEVKDVLWSDWGDGPRVLATLERLGKPSPVLGPFYSGRASHASEAGRRATV